VIVIGAGHREVDGHRTPCEIGWSKAVGAPASLVTVCERATRSRARKHAACPYAGTRSERQRSTRHHQRRDPPADAGHVGTLGRAKCEVRRYRLPKCRRSGTGVPAHVWLGDGQRLWQPWIIWWDISYGNLSVCRASAASAAMTPAVPMHQWPVGRCSHDYRCCSRWGQMGQKAHKIACTPCGRSPHEFRRSRGRRDRNRPGALRFWSTRRAVQTRPGQSKLPLNSRILAMHRPASSKHVQPLCSQSDLQPQVERWAPK
jgi:hypothetical protein